MKYQKTFPAFTHTFFRKWSVAIKLIPLVTLVGVLKYLAHSFGLEMMELNALFTSLVAGTIFLIGFLVSGVLSDYKESEKIPSEISASMRGLYDDTYTIYKGKDSEPARLFILFQKSFVPVMMDWFYKRVRTQALLEQISMMNDFIVELDREGVQPNYIIKLKNEQQTLRRLIIRVDTIRDTEFIGTAYAIVEAMGFLIAVGLIIIKIDPFYASMFFTILVTFLISYMFLLIKDLDNPFHYAVKGENGTEISLKPIHDLSAAMQSGVNV